MPRPQRTGLVFESLFEPYVTHYSADVLGVSASEMQAPANTSMAMSEDMLTALRSDRETVQPATVSSAAALDRHGDHVAGPSPDACVSDAEGLDALSQFVRAAVPEMLNESATGRPVKRQMTLICAYLGLPHHEVFSGRNFKNAQYKALENTRFALHAYVSLVRTQYFQVGFPRPAVFADPDLLTKIACGLFKRGVDAGFGHMTPSEWVEGALQALQKSSGRWSPHSQWTGA
jgi:hypothetical protein